jgi:hypothetical protein
VRDRAAIEAEPFFRLPEVSADAFLNNTLRFTRDSYSSSVTISLTSFLDCVGVILG